MLIFLLPSVSAVAIDLRPAVKRPWPEGFVRSSRTVDWKEKKDHVVTRLLTAR